jgi:hypothetical protein
MPATAIHRLDHTTSVRAVCRDCHWADNGLNDNPHGLAQAHTRHFHHDTVLIATDITVYGPTPSAVRA